MKTSRNTSGFAFLIAAAMLGGCSEHGTGAEASDLAPADAEVVAAILLDVDGTAGWSAEAIVERRTGTREFSRTVACPAGGTRGVSGEGSSSFDPTTRILTTSWTTTQFHDECTFVRSRRDRPGTVVIDGGITATGNASYQLPIERGDGREILAYTATRFGSTSTTVGDRSRTCDVDVTETYDPDTNTFDVSGTVCGRIVDFTRGGGERRDG